MSSRGRASVDAARTSRLSSSNLLPISSSASTSKIGQAPSSKKKITRIKLISLGDEGVGKSCLIKRFCEERFVSKYISTIGIDYGVKPHRPATSPNTQININFFDTSGSPAYHLIRTEFYKDTSGLILVFDVSNRDSFLHLKDWIEEAFEFGMSSDISIALCGNKCDKRRVVTEVEAVDFVKEYNKGNKGKGEKMVYYDTSAKEGANVSEVFEGICGTIVSV